MIVLQRITKRGNIMIVSIRMTEEEKQLTSSYAKQKATHLLKQ